MLTAASIVTVETRHARVWAALNQETDFSGNGGAFDGGIDTATVVKAASSLFTGGM